MNKFFQIFILASMSVGSSFAQEIHTQSNAANIANESNAVTGWTPQNSSVTTVSVEASDVYQGSYAIRIETISAASSRGKYSFSTTANTEYKIVIHAKKLALDAGFWSWEGFSDFTGVDIVGTDWNQYEFNLTASGTSATLKVYAGAPSAIGEAVLIDNISIQELDSSPPTAPVLAEVSHTNDLVNLSWTGATDNIGVTGYNVYKDNTLLTSLSNAGTYQATGLSPSTSYQFYVTALDYYGNESPASNTLTITTDGGTTTTSVWSESGSTASYTGDVAIGTSAVPSGYKLAVDGHIRTREIRVDQDTWPDYVFEANYDLPTLEEIEKHIEEKGHLPSIPSAKEVEVNGTDLGEMDRLLLEKIEELTLYILKQQKEIDQLKDTVKLSKKTRDEKTD